MTDAAPCSERFLAITALVFLFLPVLLFSSPEFRAALLTAGCLLAVFTGVPPFPGWRWLLAGLLLVHGASLAGGLRAGRPIPESLGHAAAGVLCVAGFARTLQVLLGSRWRCWEKRLGIGALGLLLAASLAAYFLPLESLSGVSHPEPLRLALFWPTRLLAAPAGQIPWEHTNHAGFIFALGFVMTMERGLANRSWWTLAIALGACVFLTGSRGGWLTIAAALPFVLIGRPWRVSARAIAVIAASLALGSLCLSARTAMLPKVEIQREAHVGGLIARGSAGRLSGYQILWDGLKGARTFGKGLAATGGPVAHLMHEHSIYLATLRGGGLVALAGHFVILAAAARAAWALWRCGTRWPGVLLAAVLAGLLFDRTSVFRITGHYEFLAHWAAVLIPPVLTGRRQEAASR